MDADLWDVDGRGAALIRTEILSASNLKGFTFDVHTYRRSGWNPEMCAALVERGAIPAGLPEFPADARDVLLGGNQGLVLAFSSRLMHFERWMLDGLVLFILGPDSDCHVVEYREQGDATIVRLEGSRREELEAVAEAMYHRVWEMQDQAQRTTLAQLVAALAPQQTVVNHGPVTTQIIVQGNATFGLHADLGPVIGRLQKLRDAFGGEPLSDLVDRLERMELRLPSEEAAADQSASAAARRELKLVRFWDPGTHPRTALDRLLAMLEPDELRLLLARGPEEAEVVAWVPAGAVAPMVIAGQAADELVRRGLVDEALFARLAEARPDLAEAAGRVAALWVARPG